MSWLKCCRCECDPCKCQDGASIVHGDNVAAMCEMQPDTIDLVVTSPPYDNLRTYGGHEWDFDAVAEQLWRIVKPGGVVVWIVADATIDGSETGTSFRQALRFKEIGFRLHDTMIWDKGSFTATGSLAVRYAPVFEYMFVLSNGPCRVFRPIKDKRNATANTPKHGSIRNPDGSMRAQSSLGRAIAEMGQRGNIWRISPEMSNSKRTTHPAVFPEALARDHIRSWSNEGDVVLDPFAGSFTTAKMARELGRRSIGIEVNEEYCKIGVNRLRQKVLF